MIGYLATLYLSDPAVRYNYDNKASSVKVVDSARRRKVDGGNSYPHTGIIPLSIPAA